MSKHVWLLVVLVALLCVSVARGGSGKWVPTDATGCTKVVTNNCGPDVPGTVGVVNAFSTYIGGTSGNNIGRVGSMGAEWSGDEPDGPASAAPVHADDEIVHTWRKNSGSKSDANYLYAYSGTGKLTAGSGAPSTGNGAYQWMPDVHVQLLEPTIRQYRDEEWDPIAWDEESKGITGGTLDSFYTTSQPTVPHVVGVNASGSLFVELDQAPEGTLTEVTWKVTCVGSSTVENGNITGWKEHMDISATSIMWGEQQ